MSKKSSNKSAKSLAKSRDLAEEEAFPESIAVPFKDVTKIAKDIYKMDLVKLGFEPLVQMSSFKKLEEFIFENFNAGTFKWVGKTKSLDEIPAPERRINMAIQAKSIFQKFIYDTISDAIVEVADATKDGGTKTMSWENPQVMKTAAFQRASLLMDIYGKEFESAVELVVAKKSVLKGLVDKQSGGLKKDKGFLVGVAAYIGMLLIDLMYSAIRLAIGAKQKKVHVGLAAEVVRIKSMLL